jgi:hypothetical protein
MNFHQIPSHDELHGGKAKDMTLRDHYAGLAMQGILLDPTSKWEEIPHYAYELADAMLKARNK